MAKMARVYLRTMSATGSQPVFSAEQLAQANVWRSGTLAEALGMQFERNAQGGLVLHMPVDERTFQPMRQLHGGATAALAETLGSVASALIVGIGARAVVGVELNANHLRAVRSGAVHATGELVHEGRTTHVWDIRIRDDQGILIAVCRLTNLILATA